MPVPRVASREYKVIIDAAPFADPAAALAVIRGDVADLAGALGQTLAAEFDAADPKERDVRFLDTPDATLRRNGFLFRQRVKRKSGETEYTLKCRSEDRYVAAGRDLRPAAGFPPDGKFEEDVGVPFVSRFSRSESVELAAADPLAGDGWPRTLGAAAKLFPPLSAARTDGAPCPPATPLAVVNGTTAFERVFRGPVLTLGGETAAAAATVAVIVWSRGKKGRPLTAEFSFRYGDPDEHYPAPVAAAARRVFEAVQRCDWARPDGRTKTEFMYGG